jgi:hypothetical protein
MIGGRLRDAMSDMAETIRRAFQDTASHGVDLRLAVPASIPVPFPGAQVLAPPFRPEPVAGRVPPLEPAEARTEVFAWEARIQEEEGWARWQAGAEVCVLPLFRSEGAARLEVPPLPRCPRCAAVAPETFRTRGRAGWEALPSPGAFRAPCALEPPRARRALEAALALPVAFASEDIPRIPKNLWMRYTLKMVKETGENIRNLEVLGLYRIPSKGTRQVNHQASTGRLLVNLGPEAEGARKAPFILARKKDDGSVVCCFVEDV